MDQAIDLNRFELVKIDKNYNKPYGSGNDKWKILSYDEA